MSNMSDNIKIMALSASNIAKNIRRIDESVMELEQVSGKTIEELVELFASGWELRPPTKVSDLLNMMDLEE